MFCRGSREERSREENNSMNHQQQYSTTSRDVFFNSGRDREDDGGDDESPSPLPKEILFNHSDCDDDTLPSELSTLIHASQYPYYNHSYVGNYSTTSSMISSRRAFRMAAVACALFFIGMLFLADTRHMMMMMMTSISSESAVPIAEVASQIPAPTMDWGWIRRTKKKKSKSAKKDKAKKSDDDDDDLDVEDDEELIMPPPQEVDPAEELQKIVEVDDESAREVAIPTAYKRCPYVIDVFELENQGITDREFLRAKYLTQSTDMNVFYRATCLLFWKDFAAGHWGRDQNRSINLDDMVLLEKAKYEDGTYMSPMSSWTWITGDQHLSNFGAWKNRGGEVVYSVNDFDQAAIYDFHIDVLRIAVSICNHGFTNGLSRQQVLEALEAFTYTYVKTVIDYVGGDKELLYELTPTTSTGYLRDFLWDVQDESSQMKQLQKFTEVGSDGMRRFIRNSDTKLQDVPPNIELKVRAEMNATRYGASMMKMGWKVRGWDDDFFTVLDVVRRVGSGIGSFGVDRYYVLLKGHDMSLEEDRAERAASVILDVKLEPESAVSRILDEVDPPIKAWYGDIFQSEADRAAQAQRRLTSYTDPFVGFVHIDGSDFIVRQRSPYKSTFDLGKLTDPLAFTEFMEQIATATATAVSNLIIL